ncbi:thiamine phosphate synthase [Ruficoccus sp. ZRK36]|uniref:thiamine phosphate synthase n=1 Tax=Ruficoccus sp. ZRK36 TaxID=2866311 RepID=UPI001C72BC4C|nr:thiamine phosphate synthase [Ruficoccus sp. ZRK36]QYY36809.1 thiamine phosphate synthase [Ruficoccus sp. ZRK36]
MAADLQSALFYAILDTGYVPRDSLVDKCRALLAGGADIIQLRAKHENTSERIEILNTLVPLFADTEVPLVVNDDLEAALAFPGLGLHVGQDDLPPDEARERLGEGRVLGLSTHSPDQAAGAIDHAAVLDYFAVGPVFATPTKPDYTPVGLNLVSHVAGLDAPLPWFAIGGIKLHNVAQVLAAGARRVVAVSDVLCAEDSAAVIRDYKSACSR